MRINLHDMILCLSNAVDLITPELYNHHQQVAYLSYRIAEHMKLSKLDQQNIYMAALLHDVGALKANDRLEVFEREPLHINHHAYLGARLLENYEPFHNASDMIRYHHVPWDYGNGRSYKGNDISIGSHIIHLADRTCVLINKKRNVLAQIDHIMTEINKKKETVFVPDLVEVLNELSRYNYVWLELTSKSPIECIENHSLFDMQELELDGVIEVAKIISQVIDFRSHFTATHSAGVAIIAQKLGELMGFSKNECKMLLVAGYLHDIGKLAIDNSILEKPSKLDEDEFHIIRTHTFHTYRLLDTVRGFTTIKQWASYHHEKLNGMGYPFHLEGDGIPLGARIIAVADVFTAISEHRPYRKGMNQEQVINLLRSMEENGFICERVVTCLIKNIDLLTILCKESSLQASKDYNSFSEDIIA